MKFRFLCLTVMTVFVVLLCSCSSNASEKAEKALNDKIAEIESRGNKLVDTVKQKTGISEKKRTVDDIIDEKLNVMTLEEKVGQMTILGVYGNSIDNDIKYILDSYKPGGIILFDRNMDSKDQVRKFVDELNENSGQEFPLFIALDEEGGRVSRMKHDLTPPPSQESIGEGEPSDARTYAKIIAKELKNIGVNVNFAPVADVGTKDTRSFSSNANTAAEFVSNAAKGYEDEKIFYCLKHFPGIGKGTVDTHQDVSHVDASREILDAEDIVPFKKIINEQDNSKFMVMVSHLKYDAFDSLNSASLSKIVTTDLLRNELGFDGVIITDGLEMGAISNHYDYEEIGVRAVKAGADIALVCHEYENEKKVSDGILYAVRQGDISEERINESVRRILKMKMQL